ncbi:hypothetical protein GALL_533730 [mine drainage metagenome]|uniref:Uncharacterized protein n=1 Tax=mine drainage metagenome TaxID=410659 RepID=A0A1J5P0K6_9ZZZZ
MAPFANAAAAPGQWTPSLFKSGKPGSLSMLEAKAGAVMDLEHRILRP